MAHRMEQRLPRKKSGTSALHWALDLDVIDAEMINIKDGTPQMPRTVRDAGREAVRNVCPDSPVPVLLDAPWVLQRRDSEGPEP